MDGQLSLFPEEKSHVKEKKKKEETVMDSAQSCEEREKRYLHYMEFRGMNEQWIETAVGEIRIMIDALADYHDIVSKKISEMAEGYAKAAWEDQLKRIKKIQTKLEESTGYNRDRNLEICMQKKEKNNDIGEDALLLSFKRGGSSRKKNESAEKSIDLAQQQEGESSETQEEGCRAGSI